MNKNEKRKKLKKEFILNSARDIFSEKGFIDVTMKDIIEACGISRGGIYLYYSSVDEIFLEILKKRIGKSKYEIQRKINNNTSFDVLLEDYLDWQEKRLLNQVEYSLLRATYEFYFTHKTQDMRNFQRKQMLSTKNTILTILNTGVQQQVIKAKDLEIIAEHLMFVIEGLSTLALTNEINSKTITCQFQLTLNLINYLKKNDKIDKYE